MNLVHNRGAPRFYLPGWFTQRESQVALDFDSPSHVVQLKPRSDESYSSFSPLVSSTAFFTFDVLLFPW